MNFNKMISMGFVFLACLQSHTIHSGVADTFNYVALFVDIVCAVLFFMIRK